MERLFRFQQWLERWQPMACPIGRLAINTGDNLSRDIVIIMEDPTKLSDEPPHFKYLYLEEIDALDQKAKTLLKEAAQYDSSGSPAEAKASRFIAKTYTATATALLEKAISEPLAIA